MKRQLLAETVEANCNFCREDKKCITVFNQRMCIECATKIFSHAERELK